MGYQANFQCGQVYVPCACIGCTRFLRCHVSVGDRAAVATRRTRVGQREHGGVLARRASPRQWLAPTNHWPPRVRAGHLG